MDAATNSLRERSLSSPPDMRNWEVVRVCSQLARRAVHTHEEDLGSGHGDVEEPALLCDLVLLRAAVGRERILFHWE